MQSIMSQTGQGICGSSSGKQIGPIIDGPSSMPAELTWGVDDIETDAIGMVLVVVIGVVVATTVFSGIVSVSPCEVGNTPFNNGICSTMILGSLLLTSHCSLVIGTFLSVGKNCLVVESLSSST